MLFASVSSEEDLQGLVEPVDGVELRLDLFPRIDRPFLEELKAKSRYPLMFTLRKASHGGLFRGEEGEREALIRRLLAAQPPFFDLECDMRAAFLQDIIGKYGHTTKIILSYHNFIETPADLESIYAAMAPYKAYSYKIATMCHSTLDALRLLLFARTKEKMSVIGMGELGQCTRVLAPVFGSMIGYGSLSESKKTAPGQLTLKDLFHIYRYPHLTRTTSIYGLIGDPIGASEGHIYHNGRFAKEGIDAVYVKMRLTEEEIPLFFALAKQVPFAGLSVTMPLKEKVFPFIEEIDQEARIMGAVNTLSFNGEILIGTNTDGRGALEAIEKKLQVYGKKMVIIGAGGAARAIAFEAKKRGALVLILNRTEARALLVAKGLGCEGAILSAIPNFYDILVNTTSEPMPIPADKIVKGSLVMNVAYGGKEAPILLEAKEIGCQTVDGKEMFLNQAALQYAFWIGQKK